MTEIWAKLLTDEKRGQVLVTTAYDSDETSDRGENDLVLIEFRGRAVVTLTLHFSDEIKQRAAFDAITQENIGQVIAGGGSLLDKVGG